MIKLKQILSEILNTYSVEGYILSDRNESIAEINAQIRAIEKITIVDIITPENFPQKKNVEYTKIRVKFITHTNDPKQDIENFKKEILTSEEGSVRIPGIKTVKFNLDTLKRI